MLTGNFFAAYEALGYTFTDPDGDPIFAQVVATGPTNGGQQVAEAGVWTSFQPLGFPGAALFIKPNGDFEFNPGTVAANTDAGSVATMTAWIGISDRKDASGNPDTAQDGPRLPLTFTVAGTLGINSDPFVTAPSGSPVPTFAV